VLQIRGPDGKTRKVKAFVTHELSVLHTAYCAVSQLDPSRVRFVFDGERLDLHRTAQDLELENDDLIDAVVAK